MAKAPDYEVFIKIVDEDRERLDRLIAALEQFKFPVPESPSNPVAPLDHSSDWKAYEGKCTTIRRQPGTVTWSGDLPPNTTFQIDGG